MKTLLLLFITSWWVPCYYALIDSHYIHSMCCAILTGSAGEWNVENVFEELDYPNEWYVA